MPTDHGEIVQCWWKRSDVKFYRRSDPDSSSGNGNTTFRYCLWSNKDTENLFGLMFGRPNVKLLRLLNRKGQKSLEPEPGHGREDCKIRHFVQCGRWGLRRIPQISLSLSLAHADLSRWSCCVSIRSHRLFLEEFWTSRSENLWYDPQDRVGLILLDGSHLLRTWKLKCTCQTYWLERFWIELFLQGKMNS